MYAAGGSGNRWSESDHPLDEPPRCEWRVDLHLIDEGERRRGSRRGALAGELRDRRGPDEGHDVHVLRLDIQRRGIGQTLEAPLRALGHALIAGPMRFGCVADDAIHRAAVLDEQRGAPERPALRRGCEWGADRGESAGEAQTRRRTARY